MIAKLLSTNVPTDQGMDMASHGDAWAHLKIVNEFYSFAHTAEMVCQNNLHVFKPIFV